MTNVSFSQRPKLEPSIYAYSDSKYPNLLKVGYTTKDVRERIKEQYGTNRPEASPYVIEYEESAVRSDGTTFTDIQVHNYLTGKLHVKRIFVEEKGIKKRTEWFQCSKKEVKAAITAIKEYREYDTIRDKSFSMRPEQVAAVNKTINYYTAYKKENPGKIPKFLWNAKMRFGKTFTAYQLAKKMGFTKILILTFKPAVQSAWEEDLLTHIDFEGWQFVSKGNLSYEFLDKSKPFVCFGSFQDYLGKNDLGGIKAKNEWVHETKWDLVILDEYHYGAWRESAKELFGDESKKEREFGLGEGMDYFDADILPIQTKHYLYLSGTPFRAIATGEFIEEQIYNWTYSDEQQAKEEWKGENNPYLSLPKMVLLTYQMPDEIRKIALSGEFNEFDLNEFFRAEGEKELAKFVHESEVQKWLNLIRGSYLPTELDNLKIHSRHPPMPYSDSRFLNILTHTLWYLPKVSSCYAMANLLRKKQNVFFNDYKIIVAAGNDAGIGVDAIIPVRNAMQNPLKTKTITLTCGKLTTGVTIKPWTGLFMLRNLSTPESYFQAAFRVQSPWVIDNPDNIHPNRTDIIKEECYVLDFSPDRALHQIVDYSCRLNIGETNPEKKVAEFIHFLPVISYDGSAMKEINAAEILDIAMSGTSATLLARRWESALLVNVDDDTLKRLLNNKDAMNALMSIEGFRSLNDDIETILNKSGVLKKKKQDANYKDPSNKDKKELSDDEKEIKSKRKIIQEKLIKFATRIPIFMYLTDFREYSLKDIITQLEPKLFKKVTGLTISDFELLISLNVFNSCLMNDAVYKFKRYEDNSLSYTGIDKHCSEENIGLFDTTISKYDNF